MELLTAIFVFALATSVSPGPNNVMIMSSGANYGVLRSIPLVSGVCIGFPVMLIAVGLGLGSVFNTFPVVLSVMKVVGVAYLIYLALLIANAAPQSLDETQKAPIGFIEAALFQWVNPKAWIMATGAISAYVTSQQDVFLQVLLIACVFFVIAIPNTALWLLFGVSLKSFLHSPERQKIFNWGMALLLIASLYPVIADVVQDYLQW